MTTIEPTYPVDAWDLLSPVLTEERRTKMLAVAAKRTDLVRLVIQDTHHPHNVSACLRSAEALGVLNVDIVNIKERFRASTVARGVHHWLKINVHTSIEQCVHSLKEQGYKLAAGFPRPDAVPLSDVPIEQPIAIIFGNEHDGVHADWLPHLDYAFTIPMCGFVESLNISVSCAVSLYELTRKAQGLHGSHYYLNEARRQALLNAWVCQQFPSYELQLKHLRNKNS